MEALERGPREKREASPEEIEQLRIKKSLLLSRQGVLRSIESSRNPRYTKLLRDALVDLDEKLARLE